MEARSTCAEEIFRRIEAASGGSSPFFFGELLLIVERRVLDDTGAPRNSYFYDWYSVMNGTIPEVVRYFDELAAFKSGLSISVIGDVNQIYSSLMIDYLAFAGSRDDRDA